MSLLLDTHVLLWWLADNPRLPRRWRERIAGPTRVIVSAATIWEIAIKRSLGKLRIDLPPDVTLAGLASACGFEDLPVDTRHAAAVATLEPHHADPFDRLLVAQCLVDSLTLVSADAALQPYEVPLLER